MRTLRKKGVTIASIPDRLNSRLEGDHGTIKRLCRATLGFKSLKTAYAMIGFGLGKYQREGVSPHK